MKRKPGKKVWKYHLSFNLRVIIKFGETVAFNFSKNNQWFAKIY